jgi:hypothetical protein
MDAVLPVASTVTRHERALAKRGRMRVRLDRL